MAVKKIEEGELARKAIHYTASVVPVIYYFFFPGKKYALLILGAGVIFMLIAELLRTKTPENYKLFLKVFGWMIRSYERRQITGATYLLLSYFFAILFFEKNIAVIVLLFLSIGDPSACLVGLSMGRVKILGDKTLEGTIAFIASSIIVTCWIPGVPWWIKISGAVVAGMVELFPWTIDDNFMIPLVSGLVMSLLFFL